jgi:hypothetical protein
MKRRGFRELAGWADAKDRTTRLLKQVATELERLSARWKPADDDSEPFGLSELASWLPFAPPDPEFARVRLSAPGGLKGFLVVHRAVLES